MTYSARAYKTSTICISVKFHPFPLSASRERGVQSDTVRELITVGLLREWARVVLGLRSMWTWICFKAMPH